MSTRQTIYIHKGKMYEPDIHIYRELVMDAPGSDIHMEISTPYCELSIPLPRDLQERMGIK